jgi:hypothetical protein
MRLAALVILIGLVDLMALAQDARNSQIDAAKADALESLKRQVIAAHISTDLTVEDLLEKLDAGAELDRTLAGAEQLGGARWLGDQAVQIRLSIDGGRIAKMLVKAAQSRPRQSPIPPELLQRQLKWWGDRIFSATGTTTGAGDISRLRPPVSDRAWWNVSDGDRRRAVTSARDNAIDRVLQSLAPIKLGSDKTLGRAFNDPSVSRAIKEWLNNQPLKGVEFNDDLTVRVMLADPAPGLWPVLRSALEKQTAVQLPTTETDWDHLRAQVTERLVDAAGVGVAQPPNHVAGPATTMPSEAPAWSREQADAEATSPQTGSPLHTARRAEALAVEKLRDQINQLVLSPGVTVGSAAGNDPRIEQAVAKVISRARPSQVDYGSNGTVTVHVTVRLGDLWALVSGQQ